MPKLETKSFAFEIKSTSEDGSEFSGLGAAFNNIDGGFDIIHPNAYNKYLQFFKTNGVIRDEHEVTTGKVTDASIDPAQGLLITGKISDTAVGRDQRTLLKDGVIKRLSVGHFVISRTWLDSPEEIKAFWDSVSYTPTEQDLVRSGTNYGVRLITEAKPVEVSTTYSPMNERCEVTNVKNDTGQRAGRTFDVHSLDTLAVLEEYAERAERLMAKRQADGRTLGHKHAIAFKRLGDRLASLLEAIADPDHKGDAPSDADPGAEQPQGKAETKSSTNPATPNPATGLDVYAEFLAIASRLNGVQI